MNRQFTINDVFMPGITGEEPDRVRQAFHAPDLLSGSEIGQRDSAAEQLGMSYGEADAGWEDASTELKIRKAETVPGADKWVQDAPENVTFLQEDADGLMAVYQSLQDSGFLSQDDLDEGTAEEISQSGHGLVDTLERSRLANERTDLGAAVLEGTLTPEEARAKLADIDSRMASLAKRRNDPAGFYSFVEQGYRMVSRDLPQAGYRALEGGLAGATAGMAAGAIAGTAVPVVGNLTGAVGGGVAGGIAGVGAGLSRGMYESAQRMESANFLADLLNEKDDAGNYLDVDEIREKAQLYGMGSALVEMAGDVLSVGAAKLIAPFLKTAAANFGGRTLSLFTKDAIKAAIKNKQAWPVMRRFLLGVGAGAAAEGAEEAVQEGVSASIEAWLKNSLNEEGKAYFRDEQEGLFSAETWAAMAESGLEGAKVGAWFVLLPGIAQLFVDAGKVSRAREFAKGVKDVGAVVANSATAQMAPARMDTFLQTHGLNQTVYIPADAAWQMQTQGTDLVTALGWTQESLEEAASLRHDIAVPLSRLVSRLDSGTLNSVADIMREGPNAMNVFEAEEPNSFLQEDVDAINAAAEEWEFEQDMLDAELDRVRSAITEAVRSVPGLLQQIVGSADTETSVGTYVDTIVSIIEQAANRLRVYGDDVGSIIQKLNFEGLVRGADGRLHTAEEIEQMVAEEAQAEADRPFWDNVWGRLDADSLKRDFPDARRELAKKHGYGLFSRKGEGLSVDELADILKNAGWLEQDADSSTLVEMLKSKKRPKARKAVKADPALRKDAMGETLYQSYTELDDQRRAAVDAWLAAHPDGAEIREQLELHRGTPWEAQAVESILIRIAMKEIMEGRGHPPFETKLGAKSAEGVVKYLRRGEEGLWQYLSEKGMIGEAAKPGLDVNGSFIACRPSDDCARYCYAAKGQYKYVAPAVKSELIAWAVENDPARAAKLIARQYMATMEYDAGKALRLFDKGDITQEWIPLVQELNRRGVRTQVFSKRPHILRQLDPEMNVIMLSIDKTNWNMADEHPDLPIAFVYSGREDLPFLNKNEERFKAHGGVILPVMQGRKTLPKEDLEALPKWSRRYACPIDSGKKTLYNKTTNPGGWKCAHCDRDGGIGCFYGRTALPNYKEIKEDGLFVETGKREETGGRGHIDEANLYELFRAASVEDRQRILDGLALIHAELRERDIDRAEGALLPTFGGVDGRASFGNRSGAGPDAGTVGIDSDTLEQRAWHGTPHNFDAFNLQAIGSGEGAQAHGWGLYFAERKRTAEKYRKGLSAPNIVLAVEGKKYRWKIKDDWESYWVNTETGIPADDFEQDHLSRMLRKAEGDAREEDYLSAVEEWLQDENLTEEQKGHLLRQRDEYLNSEAKLEGMGQLFELEIPDNDVLLDEQKTLAEQPNIQKMLDAYAEKINDWSFSAADGFPDDWTGREIYKALSDQLGSSRAASEYLNSAGIKGITYDGRRDGRCFVVFDDKAIEVIDKLYAMQAASSQTYKTAEIQRLDDGDFLIRLFRGANLSTLAHEISHAVHLEMERLDSEGKGTDALKRDLDTLRRWQSKYDDESALRAEYDRYYKGLYGVEFDDLDTVGKLAVKQRAQREMVARGFELYLREGESPTPAMEAVFRRMGKWMKRVYASASQLDVEISDDVREVFDRWLASEEDIAAAAAANDIHGFTAPLLDSLGLQGADRLELEGMISDAMGKASDALRRDRARYRRDHIQQWRDEVEQELAADPVYQARAAMRRTPIDLDAVVDAYGQELADALRVKLPASMKKGGDNPEALAFDYGFRDAGQMIQAILNRPGTQERRKELLAQKMQDADAQFAAEDYLFEQEELRQREDKVGEALYRLELNSKTAMGRPVQPEQQDFEDFGSAEKNRWKIAREQLRTLVSNLLDEKEAQAAIQPDSYRRAASKAMREERKAILAKDWAEAVKQNYLARVNMEAAYQAGKRRDLVNKLRRQAKRFLDSATPDTRARFAVFGLSQKISLFDPTMKMVQNAADKSLDDVREFLEKMKDEGFYTVDAQIPEELFEGKKQSWKLMDWKDLQPYLEGMAVLMHMERESRKANSEAAKQAWREEMDAMAEGILALNPHRNPPADQKKRLDILRFLKGVHASHLKAETIALLLDGDQDMGPVWRAVIAPINRAQADRDRRMKQARDEMKKLFSVYEPSEWVDIRGKRIFVPGLGRGLTKEQMLAVMLNAGNESNLERLRGMGYKDNEIRAIIDMLDERDVRFVQSVWDYLETFRKESFDLEERLSGVRPQAIEAKPLQTRFGELRGGYYPVSYDPQESSKPIDADSLGTLTGSMMPAVDHGSMKQRTATGLGTPLKLTLEVVPNHVAKTLHMLAFREPVRQVARVLNDKAVNAAIESTMGVEISKALKGWLHYVAGERPGVNGWSKALSMLRKNSALYSMGVKLTTILAQFTGLLASTAEIGPRWVAAGLVRTYCRQNPFTVYRETAALSTMMENRMKSVDRDLYEMSTGLMAKGSSNKALDKFVKFQHLQEQYAFLPVGFVQMAFADLPTWQGAYAKAIHEGKSQSEAIEYADAIVTRTQVGGADKDLAGVQTGQELGKILTQFYSYFSALYQLYARRMTMLKRSGYSREAWARLGTLFLLTGVAEPILSALFTRDTPEDDEDWATWAAQKVFFNPWNMIVGVRDVFGAVESLVDGYGGKSRTASLLNDSIDSGVRFLSQLAKGEDMDPKAALKTGWKSAGLLTGMVNAQELLALEAFWDWLEDSNPDFELADLIRRKKK